jgi:hypothetical protein
MHFGIRIRDALRSGALRVFNDLAHFIHTSNHILVDFTAAEMEHAPSSAVEITPAPPIMGKLVGAIMVIVAVKFNRNLRRRVRKVKAVAPSQHPMLRDELDMRDTTAPGFMKEALDWGFFG